VKFAFQTVSGLPVSFTTIHRASSVKSFVSYYILVR
jgi:hypothetical protein